MPIYIICDKEIRVRFLSKKFAILRSGKKFAFVSKPNYIHKVVPFCNVTDFFLYGNEKNLIGNKV